MVHIKGRQESVDLCLRESCRRLCGAGKNDSREPVVAIVNIENCSTCLFWIAFLKTTNAIRAELENSRLSSEYQCRFDQEEHRLMGHTISIKQERKFMWGRVENLMFRIEVRFPRWFADQIPQSRIGVFKRKSPEVHGVLSNFQEQNGP